MLKSLLTLIGFLLLLSPALTQENEYEYFFTVESYNDYHPKEVLSIISEKIDFSRREVRGNGFYFTSLNLYTNEKISEIIKEQGFELDSFKKINEVVEESKHND